MKWIVMLGLVGVLACSDSTGPEGRVVKTAIAPDHFTCKVGETRTVTGRIWREDGQDYQTDLNFFTKNKRVASITPAGRSSRVHGNAQLARVACRAVGVTYVGVGKAGIRDSAAVVVE